MNIEEGSTSQSTWGTQQMFVTKFMNIQVVLPYPKQQHLKEYICIVIIFFRNNQSIKVYTYIFTSFECLFISVSVNCFLFNRRGK